MNGFIKPRYDKHDKDKIVSFRIGSANGKDDETGKYRYEFRTIKTDSWREARNALTDLRADIRNGTFVKPGKTTVGEYLQVWLNDYCKTSLSPRTVELYDYLYRVHLNTSIGKLNLADLTSQQLQHLYSSKLKSGLSPRTVQLCHVVMHKALKNACRINLINRNPADLVDKPKSHRPEMNTMSEEDINKFLEAAKEGEYYNLFFCYLMTGLRRSELLAIRWGDVDLLGMTISVNRSMQYLNKVKEHVTYKEPKSKGSRRLVSLSPGTVGILRQQQEAQKKLKKEINPELKEKDLIKDDDLVFSRFDGTPLLPDTISHAWAKLVKRCKLKNIRLHDARHTMATLMFKNGVHPKIVQERLGHSSITLTLDTYSHIVPGLQAAAAEGLDNILSNETKLEKELKEIIQK